MRGLIRSGAVPSAVDREPIHLARITELAALVTSSIFGTRSNGFSSGLTTLLSWASTPPGADEEAVRRSASCRLKTGWIFSGFTDLHRDDAADGSQPVAGASGPGP